MTWPRSGFFARCPSARNAYTRAIRWWIGISARWGIWVLAAPLLLTVLLAPVAARLRIDTDFNKLLPSDYPAVQHMRTAIEKVGDLGLFTIIIEHPETAQSLRFAQAFEARVKNSSFVRTVVYRNPAEYLQRNKFLAMQASDLERIRDHIKRERRKASPFALDLLDDEPSSGTTPEPDSAPAPQPADNPAASQPDALSDLKEANQRIDDMRPLHSSEDGRILGMQVRPKGSVTDLRFIGSMYAFLQDAIAQTLREGDFPNDMQVGISGSLRNKYEEYMMILTDVLRSCWVSGGLILLILLVVFRNPLAVGLMLLPLVCGLVWTFALAQQTIGFLDAISAMLFVVLFGLGIDHGIHLLKRYIQLRGELAHRLRPDPSPASAQTLAAVALRKTLTGTGRAVWISALTTAGGFLLMLVADFQGFVHLGFVAGMAMLLITAAYFVMLPALCLCLPAGGSQSSPKHLDTRLRPLWTQHLGRDFWASAGRALDRARSRPAMLLGVVLLLVGGYSATHLRFNYDFDTLIGIHPEADRVKEKQHQVYDRKHTLTPGAVLFAENEAILDALLEELHTRKRNDTQSPTIGTILSMRYFVPGDQERRLELIRDSARLITPLVIKRERDPELRRLLRQLRSAANLTPVTQEDIPEQIASLLRPKDGSNDHMIFVYPTIERRRVKESFAFADDMAPIEVAGKLHHPTGDSLVFAAILRMVIDQGLGIFALSLAAIVLLVWLQFRRRRCVMPPLLALAGGLALMAIVLVLGDVDVNFYNMIIFAAIVGMGIDSGIHLSAAWHASAGPGETQRKHHKPMSRAGATIATLGGPITACALTTAAGYSGMIFSHHNGLRSIGILAVTGLAACWLVAVTLLPIYLRMREPSQRCAGWRPAPAEAA